MTVLSVYIRRRFSRSLLSSGSRFISAAIAASGSAMVSRTPLLIARTRPATASGLSLIELLRHQHAVAVELDAVGRRSGTSGCPCRGRRPAPPGSCSWSPRTRPTPSTWSLQQQLLLQVGRHVGPASPWPRRCRPCAAITGNMRAAAPPAGGAERAAFEVLQRLDRARRPSTISANGARL